MDMDWVSHISGKHILHSIAEMKSISDGDSGGRTAYAFSHVEDALFKYIKSYAYDLNKSYTVLTRNLDFYEDAIGNLYVLLDSDKDVCVACGTHVDAGSREGNPDGWLGVAAGLEIMRVLFQKEIVFNAGFCLMVFRAGEALSTGMKFLGSKVAARQISKEELKSIQYGIDKKVGLETVFDYKNLNKEKIFDGLDMGYVYKGRYNCLLELHEDKSRVLIDNQQRVGVAVDCEACTQVVVDVVSDVYRKLSGGNEIQSVLTDEKFDADSFVKVDVPAGVVLVDSLKDETSVELGAKLVASVLGRFGGGMRISR